MTVKSPLITIITVVYNSAHLLEDTILSVLNQHYSNLEYIIIDGGSTDGSLEIIKQYKSKIAKYVSEPDKGIYDAMNKGILLAKGDVIGLLNAGDTYEPGILQTLAEWFEPQNKYTVYFGDTIFNYKDLNASVIVPANPESLYYQMGLCHQSIFITNAAYKEFGLYNTRYKYSADYALVLNLKLKGIKFINLKTIVSNYLAGGVSDKKVLQSRLERLKAHTILKSPKLGKTIYIAIKEVVYQFAFNTLKFVKGTEKNNIFWKKRLMG